VFASKAWNPAGVDGLLMGNPDFLWKQVVAAVVSGLWAFGFTYGMLWLINKMTPVLIDEHTQETGLDQSCMVKKPTAGRCENRAFARQRPCVFLPVAAAGWLPAAPVLLLIFPAPLSPNTLRAGFAMQSISQYLLASRTSGCLAS
jgi:hypothetical protein